MNPEDGKTNQTSSGASVPVPDHSHTPGGAPTDRAHQDHGDGTLTGSLPAGLSLEELREAARSSRTEDGGTG